MLRDAALLLSARRAPTPRALSLMNLLGPAQPRCCPRAVLSTRWLPAVVLALQDGCPPCTNSSGLPCCEWNRIVTLGACTAGFALLISHKDHTVWCFFGGGGQRSHMGAPRAHLGSSAALWLQEKWGSARICACFTQLGAVLGRPGLLAQPLHRVVHCNSRTPKSVEVLEASLERGAGAWQ